MSKGWKYDLIIPKHKKCNKTNYNVLSRYLQRFYTTDKLYNTLQKYWLIIITNFGLELVNSHRTKSSQYVKSWKRH